MKTINKYLTLFSLMSVALFSCEQPDLSEGRVDQVNGLLNVTISIPGNPAEFYAVKKGPYQEGEEIQVKVPTSDDAPLDVTRLFCSVSLEHNCYVDPPIGGVLDFTEPRSITVVDVQGTRHTNTIRVVPTPPKTRFSKLWSKTNLELGIPSRENTGCAVNDKYVAVQELNGKFFLFDKKTGNLVKTVDAASSWMMKADTDAAGHFVTSRWNIYGAGFMVYVYDDETESHKLLLNYAAGDGCPENMGYEMSVCGDVTKGKSFIYGIAPDNMNIYSWELNDGVLVTPANKPNVLRYGPAKKNWKLAQVQRASIEDNSNHYFSFLHEGSSPEEGGSEFHIFTPDMDITMLNKANTMYKILDFKVFDVEGDRFLVTNEQGYDAWSENVVQVFEITNTGLMELKPEDDGYDKFRLFKSDSVSPCNYNKWGDVSISMEENANGYDIYILASTVGFKTEESVARMYKMTYYRQ